MSLGVNKKKKKKDEKGKENEKKKKKKCIIFYDSDLHCYFYSGIFFMTAKFKGTTTVIIMRFFCICILIQFFPSAQT